MVNFERIEFKKEHDAWQDMFNVMCEKFNLTTEQLNDVEEYRKVFERIERWAYYDRERRKVCEERYKDDKGLFWKGDEE